MRRRQFLAVCLGTAAAPAVAAASWLVRRGDVAPTEVHGGAAPPTTPGGPSAPPPAVVGIYARWVADENARPGTRDWMVGLAGEDEGDLEGYAGVTSAVTGEAVQLFVSTRAPEWWVEVYRLGWYQGLGGRLVWRSAAQPGVDQGPPTVDPDTNTVECAWEPSMTLTVGDGADWPPGCYFLKLVASNDWQKVVPLTIRDDTSTAAFAVVNAVANWQAYNEWGRYSLYFGRPRGGQRTYERRARVVSFDRPYDGIGAGDFIGNEFPLIRRLEEWGLDVTYLTSIDLHRDPARLARHRAMLSLGHDEYWSAAMRAGAEDARDAGVNLAFFGANACFRQVRFEPSPLGAYRRQVCYKSADEDPIRDEQPDLTTVDWRTAPLNRPEAALIGQQYQSNPVEGDLVVVDPGAWIFEGLGLADGEVIEGVIGTEYDRYLPAQGGPENVQVVCHSPVRVRGRGDYADVTYYSAPSGAGVFATGTNWWISKHDPPGDGSPYQPTIIEITKNVLRAFGSGPTGAVHPSVPNYSALAQGRNGG